MTETYDTSDLEQLISGRVVPHIYAFRTPPEVFPRYLKVGDTYRPVEKRLEEWNVHFPGLKKVFSCKAVLDDSDIYFRDYSVHKVLEDKSFPRMTREYAESRSSHFPKGKAYFSNEFFKDAEVEDVKDAIKQIEEDFVEGGHHFDFYSVKDIKPEADDDKCPDPVDLELRPNQKDAVKAFMVAKAAKRENLLMYAVMRFGKTVTALKCAAEMNARFVVVVSGKADVEREWRLAVHGFTDFKDYVFVGRDELARGGNNYVASLLKAGKRVVYFDTLMDFCDKKGEVKIKDKHRQIFKSDIDLLIIDETHFAARAENCGKILEGGKPVDCKSDDQSEGLNENQADAALAGIIEKKVLKAKIKLHLSGTPYRILMGSEFQKEDIVSFCQFTDIIAAQKKWDAEHLGKTKKDGSQYEEWDNPYYGFPEMVRFAFNLNESAKQKLEELKELGVSSRFGELLKTESIKPDKKHHKHRKFVHEKEVVELFKAIGGSKKDKNILSFLNYFEEHDKVLCNHIVCVLPWKSSCDALEALLSKKNRKYKGQFGKLSDYTVFNIAGHDLGKGLDSPEKVITAIGKAEGKRQKTLTLTVDRMLTGNTVPEWDTMLFLKDSSSPQMYDQAIFRLQSSFIRVHECPDGKKIKLNMKPQTLLVDFDPGRMFRLQEERAQIYNVNTGTKGNAELEARLEEELRVSPVVRLDESGIHRVLPSDVMRAVCEYSSKRGVADEVLDVPVGKEELTNPQVRALIERMPELGSREGLTISPYTGDKTDGTLIGGEGGEPPPKPGDPPRELPKQKDEMAKLVRRLQTYRSLIIFFSFLTKDRVQSLDAIIACIDKGDDNRRIARHLGLEKPLLEVYRQVLGWTTLRKLDQKIQNLDYLANETEDIDLGEEYEATPKNVKKAIVAMRKFGRLGEAKIVTPPNIAYDMVNQIPASELKAMLKRDEKILDPASKMGEFAIAIVRRCAEKDVGLPVEKIKSSILSIPMCGVTYEFTRKVYDLLGLDSTCIAEPEKIDSYKLIDIRKDGKVDYDRIAAILKQNKSFNEISIDDEVAEGNTKMCMKIGAVIGNPPYQDMDGSGGTNDAPIYQYFSEAGKRVSERYASLIIKSGWMSAGRENLLGWFRHDMLNDKSIKSIKNYIDSMDVFDAAQIKGGICYYFRDNEYEGECNYSLVRDGEVTVSEKRDLSEFDILIRDPRTAAIVKKVMKRNLEDGGRSVSEIISADTPFGIPSNPTGTKKSAFSVSEAKRGDFDVALFYLKGSKRCIGYAKSSEITKNKDDIKFNKVFIPAAYGAGESFPHQILGVPEIGPKKSVCSQTYLYAKFTSDRMAKNFVSYLKCRLFRLLVCACKITQHAQQRVYRFVPMQDFNESWTDKKLYEKYGITPEEQKFIESMIKPME